MMRFLNIFTHALFITHKNKKLLLNDYRDRVYPTDLLQSKRFLSSDPVACSNGMINVTVEFFTDLNPKRNKWELINKESKNVVMSEEYEKSDSSTRSVKSECLPDDESYQLLLFDSKGISLVEGYLKLTVNGNMNKQIDFPPSPFESLEANICSSSDPCYLGDECSVCNPDTRVCEPVKIFTKECRSNGNPTTVAIKVSSLDSSSTITVAELQNQVFDISNSNSFSMASQFSACSFSQFQPIPYPGTFANFSINQGVAEIKLPMNTINVDVGTVVDKSIEAITMFVQNIDTHFDFVILCLPPGSKIGTSTTWKAYAHVNSYLSVYNDRNCLYPSVIMHEIGHNIGLSHSSDEVNYGDETGMMGLSYNLTNGPMKCFNGAKSWQLGWYGSSHIEIGGSQLGDFIAYVDLYGIDTYATIPNKKRIMKLFDLDDGYDYYLMFNEKKGMTAGAKENGDAVLVTRRPSGTLFEDSKLVGSISRTGNYVIYNYKIGKDLVISRDQSREQIQGYVMLILQEARRACDEDIECNDRNICTFDYCENNNTITGTEFMSFFTASGTCFYKQLPCGTCGAEVGVQVTTDDSRNIIWNIFDQKQSKVVRSSGYLSETYKKYTNKQCLQYGKYIFTISKPDNDTTLSGSNANFQLTAGDSLIDVGNLTDETFIESLFIICETDNDCQDYDGCSIDFCDKSTNLCNNTESSCSGCTWLTFNLTTDNYPEETDWILFDTSSSGSTKNKNNDVLSGNPYPFDIISAYGRRSKPTRQGRRQEPTLSGRRSKPTKAGRRSKPTKATRISSQRSSELNHRSLKALYGEEVNEEICLENDYLYKFIIRDAFGDGMCCSEGYGGYAITVNNILLKEGGDFESVESTMFQFKVCILDSDCNSVSNPCLVGVCHEEISTCTYTHKECRLCGGIVSFQVVTDTHPFDNTWEIISDKTLTAILSGGPYSTAYEVDLIESCLSFGSYKLVFQDATDDGFNGLFQLKIDNHIVIDYNSSVYFSEYIQDFGICMHDSDCNDNDPCTIDVCDETKRICMFHSLPCSDCGKDLIEIDMYTDFAPHQSRWNVLDFHDTSSIIIEGPRYNSQLHYEHYHFSKCLPSGKYIFEITDVDGDGMTFYCSNPGQCGYKVSINNKLIIDGYGKFEKNLHYFQLSQCLRNEECDDENSCTVDSCDVSTQRCMYNLLSCDECGDKMYIHLRIDDPMLNSTNETNMSTEWVISDAKRNLPLMLGGPYPSSYFTLVNTRCFPFGEYDFTITGLNGCYGGQGTCGYRIEVGSKLVAIGGDYKVDSENKHIVVEPKNITLISAIQGTEDVSPYLGEAVTVVAIVIANYYTEYDKFFLQEEDEDSDDNVLTSEGIFVYEDGLHLYVNPGDKVEVSGTVSEYAGQTEIIAQSIDVISSNNTLPTPATITFPVSSVVELDELVYIPDLRKYLGMQIKVTNEMIIQDMTYLDQYNEILMLSKEAVQQGLELSFTQNHTPDIEAYKQYLQEVAASSITYDDGFWGSYDYMGVEYLDGFQNFTANATFRRGDVNQNLNGVLEFTDGKYRILSKQEGDNIFTSMNTRLERPPEVGYGIKVASLDTMNFFITLAQGNNTVGPKETKPLGATVREELERQLKKLVTTISALDADILGILRIENDFNQSKQTALETLVNEVNTKGVNEPYRAVYAGDYVDNTDSRSVAIIYRPSKLKLVGTPVVLNDASLPDEFVNESPLFDGYNTSLAPLAATFLVYPSRECITVVSVYLHERTGFPDNDDVYNEDIYDGAGAWNERRTTATAAIANWIATHPTGNACENIAIMGNLNAFPMENPIQYLLSNGYKNSGGDSNFDYTFLEKGLVGTIDYILPNDALSTKLRNAVTWHIGENEASALDYRFMHGRDYNYFDGKSAARVSDHSICMATFKLISSPPACYAKTHRKKCKKECKGYKLRKECKKDCDFDFTQCKICRDYDHRKLCRKECKGMTKQKLCLSDCDFDFSICRVCFDPTHRSKCRSDCKGKTLQEACVKDCMFDFAQC